MKKIIFAIALCIAACSYIFTGCADDTVSFMPITPNVSGLTPLDTSYAIGGRAKVFLYTNSALKTGYNKLYFVMYDSVTNNVITDAHIEIEPENHGASAPVENPPQTASTGIFEGAIIFTDPQVTDHWHLHVHVHNHQAPGEPEGEAELEGFSISANPDGFIKYFTMDSTMYLFSLIKPSAPAAGLNDFEFLLNKRVNSAFFPDTTFTVNITAQQLQQGFFSTGNVNPTASSNGHYNGKINLTAPGTWKVMMHFNNTIVNDSAYFQVTY